MEDDTLHIPSGKCWDCKTRKREESPQGIYCEQCRKKEGPSFLLLRMIKLDAKTKRERNSESNM